MNQRRQMGNPWPPAKSLAAAAIGGLLMGWGARIGFGCNIGAFVGEGTMVDSHALIGSCAQIGARVHVSAAAQIGGVLEPANARPVIVEDDCFVGGNCGLYEGVLLRRGAVLAGLVARIGNVDFFSDDAAYAAAMPDVTGLQVNDAVKVAGVDVGTPGSVAA